MRLAKAGAGRGWIIRNFWLFTMLLNLILVLVLLLVLAILIS